MDDLRVPIGTFFAIVGVILIAMSGAHSPLTEAPSIYTPDCRCWCSVR